MSTSSKRNKKMPQQVFDIAYRRRLLERWDHVCVVCGRPFANLACVTKEHLVPKSSRERSDQRLKTISNENIAPSHYRCNNLRKTNSIVATARLIDKVEHRLGPRNFEAWLNKQIPGIEFPSGAHQPLKVAQFMELPEHLPGM